MVEPPDGNDSSVALAVLEWEGRPVSFTGQPRRELDTSTTGQVGPFLTEFNRLRRIYQFD